MQNESSRPKVGLALGSGASRALAHIGVIDAVEEAGIPIDYIAGSSMGALIGAAYASGGLEKLRSEALKMDWRTFTTYLDLNFPQQGLLEGDKLIKLIEFLLPCETFEELHIPLCVTATNLSNGEEIDFEEGDLIEAIRASTSLPGIFNPCKIDGMHLVDGGMINPVPVDVVRNMGADIIIAVDLNNDIITRNGRQKRFKVLSRGKDQKPHIAKSEESKSEEDQRWMPTTFEQTYRSLRNSMDNLFTGSENDGEEEWEPNIFDVIANSINIMEYHITQSKLMEDQPDILVQPQLGHLNLFDFEEADNTIEEGYNVARTQIEQFGPVKSASKVANG
jgi:NTE family protein